MYIAIKCTHIFNFSSSLFVLKLNPKFHDMSFSLGLIPVFYEYTHLLLITLHDACLQQKGICFFLYSSVKFEETRFNEFWSFSVQFLQCRC